MAGIEGKSGGARRGAGPKKECVIVKLTMLEIRTLGLLGEARGRTADAQARRWVQRALSGRDEEDSPREVITQDELTACKKKAKAELRSAAERKYKPTVRR